MSSLSLSLRVEAFFKNIDHLRKVWGTGFEWRQEQVDIACKIAQTLEQDGVLLAEAGCGTGKTIAYLLPAILSQKKVLISTGTKALQEQIVQHDIPKLALALKQNIQTQLLKGRDNYLCLSKAEDVLRHRPLPGFDFSDEYDAVALFASQTHTGDKNELPPGSVSDAFWKSLSASEETCAGRECELYEQCYVTRMRQQAQVSDITIINHHLFFADALLMQSQDQQEETRSILPPYDILIFDEAHEIEDVAAERFGLRIDLNTYYSLLDAILMESKLETNHDMIYSLVTSVRREAEAFFKSVHRFPSPKEPEWMWAQEPEIYQTCLKAFKQFDQACEALEAAFNGISVVWLKKLAARFSRLCAQTAFAMQVEPRQSLLAQSTLESWMQSKQDADVSVFARYVKHGSRIEETEIIARPIESKAILGSLINRSKTILLSATLRFNQSFEHTARKFGLRSHEEITVPSPFHFKKQAGLYIASDIPSYKDDRFGYYKSVEQHTLKLIEASQGGAFILCSSLEHMHRLYSFLSERVSMNIAKLGTGSVDQLTKIFKEDGNSILLGSKTLWQGVDIPGMALRLVIIDKIPFEYPNHPVVLTRKAMLDAQNKNDFSINQIPYAALRLRQGIGRLIRSKTDRGLIAILDTRMHTARYAPMLKKDFPNFEKIGSLQQAMQYLQMIQVSHHNIHSNMVSA